MVSTSLPTSTTNSNTYIIFGVALSQTRHFCIVGGTEASIPTSWEEVERPHMQPVALGTPPGRDCNKFGHLADIIGVS